MRWAEHVARLGERRGVYGVLMGQTEGNRPLGRPRLRWEDNIKMDLQEVECGGIDWIDVAQVSSGVPRGWFGGFNPPPRNSEDIGGVLDRMSKKDRHLDFLS